MSRRRGAEDSGDLRRRPARPPSPDRPIPNQRARLDPSPIHPEPLDRDPTAHIQRYRFGPDIFLKSPSLYCKSTRGPDLFKSFYAEVLFLVFDPLSFFNFEPAVHPWRFCTLDPGINVYLRFSPQILQKTPWNSVFLTIKPLELVFSLENAF